MLFADQTLICDADDTLWECNTYFEQAIHRFMEFLHAEHLSREEIREVLDTFERKNGYGARAFAKSMVETFRELATENDPGDEERIEQLGLAILETEMEPIHGVAKTLAALRPHHCLLLFTKGDEEEQQIKINRSSLSDFFEFHIIAADKTVDTYSEIIANLQLDPASTWMIGNSLKSDIQPALQAGLHAIYVPNPHTWHMEHTEFEHDESWPGTYLELNSFAELTSHFVSESTR